MDATGGPAAVGRLIGPPALVLLCCFSHSYYPLFKCHSLRLSLQKRKKWKWNKRTRISRKTEKRRDFSNNLRKWHQANKMASAASAAASIDLRTTPSTPSALIGPSQAPPFCPPPPSRDVSIMDALLCRWDETALIAINSVASALTLNEMDTFRTPCMNHA